MHRIFLPIETSIPGSLRMFEFWPKNLGSVPTYDLQLKSSLD